MRTMLYYELKKLFGLKKTLLTAVALLAICIGVLIGCEQQANFPAIQKTQQAYSLCSLYSASLQFCCHCFSAGDRSALGMGRSANKLCFNQAQQLYLSALSLFIHDAGVFFRLSFRLAALVHCRRYADNPALLEAAQHASCLHGQPCVFVCPAFLPTKAFPTTEPCHCFLNSRSASRWACGSCSTAFMPLSSEIAFSRFLF